MTLRLSTSSALLLPIALLTGCSDDTASAETPEMGSTGGAEGDEASDGASSSGAEPAPVGVIEGRILWIDGSSTALELEAEHERLELGGQLHHTCGGTDLEAGFTLAVQWIDGTEAGTYPVSFSDGPMILAAWPQVDGEGIRATSVGMGEVTFDQIGTEPGDMVSGTASAVLSPQEDDPDDRVREIVDIAFDCAVER